VASAAANGGASSDSGTDSTTGNPSADSAAGKYGKAKLSWISKAGFKDVIRAAKESGVNPVDILTVMYLESKGDLKAVNKKTHAAGPFQFMDPAREDMKLSYNDSFNFYKATKAAIAYSYVRYKAPNPKCAYVIHNLGPTGYAEYYAKGKYTENMGGQTYAHGKHTFDAYYNGLDTDWYSTNNAIAADSEIQQMILESK
jgi:hypothetical protein